MTKKSLLYSGVLAVAFLVFSSFVLTNRISAYGLTAAGAPMCNNAAPARSYISTIKVVGTSSVKLTWNGVNGVTSWTVAFGVKSGKYIYGANNFGDASSRSITINNLPKAKYYFVLRANNGCAAGPFSPEVSVSTSSVAAPSQPVTFTTTTVSKATPTPAPVVVYPSPAGTNSDFGLPTPTPAPVVPVTPTLTWWQQILNFFARLFGK